MDTSYSISLKTTWQYILRDISRYHVTEKRSYLAILVMCPGLIAGIYYRIGHWIWHYQGRFASLLLLVRPPYMVLRRIIEIYTGISLSTRARIGSGLYINHFGSIFLGAVVMGENCTLSHEVTIGVGGRDHRRGLPILGNRVHVGPGAKIFGSINIGDDVAIGANAVVTTSMPDCAVVVGVPAKVISYEGSFEYVLYNGMQSDPNRQKNVAQRDRMRLIHPITRVNGVREAFSTELHS